MPDGICNATFEIEETDYESTEYTRVLKPYQCERKEGHQGGHATNTGKSETQAYARLADEFEADRAAHEKLLERAVVALESLARVSKATKVL